MNGTRVPSGRSAIASMPRTGRSSFSAIAIGHWSCGIGVPSGQYSFHEPHHSLVPSGGRWPHSSAAASLIIGEPPGGVGGVDGGGQGIEQVAEPAFALAQCGLRAQDPVHRHDVFVGRGLIARRYGPLEFAFKEAAKLVHPVPAPERLGALILPTDPAP